MASSNHFRTPDDKAGHQANPGFEDRRSPPQRPHLLRPGRLIEGTLEAESERAVVAQLRERGYLPTMLREQVAAPSIADQMRRSTPKAPFTAAIRKSMRAAA